VKAERKGPGWLLALIARHAPASQLVQHYLMSHRHYLMSHRDGDVLDAAADSPGC
jgi:hypothetical protein